jgi:Bacterial Ig-like domain
MLACLAVCVTTRRLLWGFAMLAALAASAIGVAPPAHAATAVRETPDRTWNTNGTVFDTELSKDGSTLYIGGKFTSVRETPPGEAGRSFAANGVAAIDVATGEAKSGWNPNVAGGAATVRALELSADGYKLFIGGNFASVGGQPRQNLAAVDATYGTVDAFAPTVTASGQTPWVYALLAEGSKLYAGGSFSNVDGRQRAKLAAFDINPTGGGELDPAWRPNVNGNNVRELEVAPADSAGSSIFAAGRFTSLTGTDGVSGQRESVARVYTTGTETGNLHPWAIPLGVVGSPQVGHDLTVSADGTRLYGGFGLGPNFAAAFRLDDGDAGTQVWRVKTVGNVQTVELSPDGTRLFLGGHFGTNRLEQTVCGDQQLSGLASVNPATGAIYCDWVPQLEPSVNNANGAWDFTSTDTHLWLGGGFTHVSGLDQRNLARFRYDSTPPRVVRAVPAKGSTGVFGGINVRASFSERAYKVRANFKLYRKGSSIPVPAVVSSVEGTNDRRWVLNPKRPLKAGTTYIAKVLTGVEDGAGNHLDQDHFKAGDQLMRWAFKTRS